MGVNSYSRKVSQTNYFLIQFHSKLLVDGPNLTAKDVSILVTEASPECPTAPLTKNRLLTESATSTLVHVLVHRESEEYQTDLEDGGTDKGTGKYYNLYLSWFRYNQVKNFQMKNQSNQLNEHIRQYHMKVMQTY